MSTSLDNIWDEPITPSSPKQQPQPSSSSLSSPPNSPKAPSKQPLFLNDSDDEDTYIPRKSNARFKASSNANIDVDPPLDELDPDIDALFNVEPLKSVDTEQLAREAAEKYKDTRLDIPGISSARRSSALGDDDPSTTQQPTQQGRSGKDDSVVKERKKVVRLDEAKLLASVGFPELVKRTKDFKIKGKGYEAQDLNRLMQVYQFWTHELYPKTTFKDTVNRIEKLCHSKRMNVALSVWRDESNGITRSTQQGDESSSSDDEGPPKTTEATTNVEESEPEDHPPPSSRPSSAPPSDMEIDDDEIEAMIREQEQQALSKQKAPSATCTTPDSEMMNIDDIDDQELWDIVDQVRNDHSNAAQPEPQAVAAVVAAPPEPAPAEMEDEEYDVGLEYM
ncbi:Swi3-domain-containing protein [Pluteus cervinus]|uniref:Swi3-domain-containing protein n=1 Tax=Pluteus cervinus TaxID=181527 RepID=A0ACD3BDW4_9AGAR|nr:Swi3-domain-containing protein [Pluteus cervinus]